MKNKKVVFIEKIGKKIRYKKSNLYIFEKNDKIYKKL